MMAATLIGFTIFTRVFGRIIEFGTDDDLGFDLVGYYQSIFVVLKPRLRPFVSYPRDDGEYLGRFTSMAIATYDNIMSSH